MARSFALPAEQATAGWKAKIRDREVTEPPHVSILWKRKVWRMDLRTKKFMDTSPPARDVPQAVVDALLAPAMFEQMVEAWNEMYPHNQV